MSERFVFRHRASENAFIRTRKLPFSIMLQLLLKKSVKSLQLMLRDFGEHVQISASAFTQARRKILHTAFIELLEKGVKDVMYKDGDYRRFKGHRVLAVDGSSLRLPTNNATISKFGLIKHLNGKRTSTGNQVEAKMTVLYDVLNSIPLSAYLHAGRTNDLFASKSHLQDLRSEDLVIADRAYGSFQFFAEIMGKKANFLIRCKNKSFEKYHKLFSESAAGDIIVDIPRPRYLKDYREIPEQLRIRFLRIPLESGEIEVLATSLIDAKAYPHRDFKKLYYLRWNVETFFHVLKSRLCLDNFTGKSVEAIYQDFYSTIFISGFETIMTSEANEILASKKNQLQQKVNKSVSFHALKSSVIDLLFEQPPDFQEKITQLFLLNPTLIRPDRVHSPRKILTNGSNRRSLYFQRYFRKHVF